MNALIQQFNPSQIAIIDHNGGKWLTAEQLGLALGFSEKRARDGVNNLYNRHIDEFSDGDSVTIKLMATDGKAYNTRIFSHSGCNLLSFFANTPNAKAFRAWAKEKLAEPAADAALLKQLQTAYLESNPEAAKVLRYYGMGLNQHEIGKLMGCSADTVRVRLKKLSALGFSDYTPSEKYIRAGQRGIAAMREHKAFLAAQQSLGLEG